MAKPLVSIIIPTYYREERLHRAIESALSQAYENTEIVVVDDSGEAFAADIASEYSEIKYVNHDSNQGGNPARNTGYSVAIGEYIQLLDDDDELHPRKIADQVKLLEARPSIGVAYAGINDRNGNDVFPTPPSDNDSLKQALQLEWPTTITSSLLIERSVFDKVYPLKQREAADDLGMKIELAQRTEFGFVDDILTDIGRSERSRSTSTAFVTELEKIIEKYSHLYDRYPKQVKYEALGYICWLRGNNQIMERGYPFVATGSYLRALRYSRELDPVIIGSIVASFFGRPGFKLASLIRNRYEI